jgi:hypothetical protein
MSPGTPSLLDIVLFLEFFDATRRIDDILLPGVKRMAVRADLNVKVFRCGPGLNLIAAGAFNDRIFILGMNIRFHLKHLLLMNSWP